MNLGEWDDTEHAEDGDQEGEDTAPYFGSLDEFVREMIVPVFRRRVGERDGRHWAADWWNYHEAVLRLDALWHAWEHLRLDPTTGMSVWLRDHLDHHLPILMSEAGPFGRSKDHNDHGEPLPYAAPPAGLYSDEAQAGPDFSG